MNTINDDLEQNYMTITELAESTHLPYNSIYKFLRSHFLIEKIGHMLVIKKSLIDVVLQYKSFRERGERFNFLLFRIEDKEAFERVVVEVTK